MVFDFASTYSGYFFINVNTFKHTYTQIFFFCKEENEVLRTFIHLESCDKNVHLYDSTMWCVRVCICYVGWQNTSYTVDTACTPSLSGLATAINRCTLFLFHCEMPPRDSRQARTVCRSFLQGQVNPASEVVRP